MDSPFKETNIGELSESIYSILTGRKFRAGPLPADEVKRQILLKIKLKVSKNLPIKLFQFWGGCKNPNLPADYAELCEEATLNNLSKLNFEVKQIYQPGVKIYICPGDSRVERVNLIPHKKTKNYVESLIKISEYSRFNGIFAVMPLSILYQKYFEEFERILENVKIRISKDIEKRSNFEKLILNARKNIFSEDLESEEKIQERSANSARDYVIYRVAEEETKIFRDFNDCIRTFFIKYTPFYKQYIQNIDGTAFHLECHLVFFTGKKGNITQPWQAIGKKDGENVIFLSQERLKRLNN